MFFPEYNVPERSLELAETTAEGETAWNASPGREKRYKAAAAWLDGSAELLYCRHPVGTQEEKCRLNVHNRTQQECSDGEKGNFGRLSYNKDEIYTYGDSCFDWITEYYSGVIGPARILSVHGTGTTS
ncbi:hypothetical protein Bbelb_384510 [Branchiostoma belcheri]|nr:hypothetical protein Bbelb_384510 [Branchiostoma belcheri]